MFIKANSFAWEFQIIWVVLSGNLGYSVGYCRGNGNCGFEYGTLSIILIVIGCILGFCWWTWCLGKILNSFSGSGEEYLHPEDNKEMKDERFQGRDNRRIESQVEDNSRNNNVQTSINEYEELITLNPPAYLESFSHSCVSLKNEIETEDKQLTEKNIHKRKYDEFLKRQKSLDDRRY